MFLRKSIKKRMARAYKKPNNRASIAAYHGWAIHCNSAHLIKKLENEEVRRI
jgi:RNA-directed DNA polymerase